MWAWVRRLVRFWVSGSCFERPRRVDTVLARGPETESEEAPSVSTQLPPSVAENPCALLSLKYAVVCMIQECIIYTVGS